MSDKAKQFFDNYDCSEKINMDDLIISERDILQLMQSYADQEKKLYLEKVLEGAEKVGTTEQGRDLAIKYANTCEFKSDFPHDWNSVNDGYKEGFKIGFRLALNLLKQKQ